MLEVLDIQLEDVARSMLLVVKNNINATIDEVWAEMVAEDTAFYAALGQPVPVTPKPYPTQFFLGHFPSILERDLADYPNITAVAYQHRSTYDAGDQYEIAGNTCYLEAFVAHADESTVNRLAWRYAKALHRVIARNRDLGDTGIEYVTWTPNVSISNAAARRVDQFQEDIVFLQGCRLEYELRTQGTW